MIAATAIQESEILRLICSLILASVGVFPRECHHGLRRLECSICTNQRQRQEITRRHLKELCLRPRKKRCPRFVAMKTEDLAEVRRLARNPFDIDSVCFAKKPMPTVYAEDYRFERLAPRYDCTREFQRYQFTHLSRSRYRRDGAAEQRAIAAALREAQTGPGILEIGEFAPNIVRVVREREMLPALTAGPDKLEAWSIVNVPPESAAFNTPLDRFINGDDAASKSASKILADLSAGHGGKVVRGIPEPYTVVQPRVLGSDPDGGLIVERICRWCRKWVGPDHEHGEVEAEPEVEAIVPMHKARKRDVVLTPQQLSDGAAVLREIISPETFDRLHRYYILKHQQRDIAQDAGVTTRAIRKSLAVAKYFPLAAKPTELLAKDPGGLRGYVIWLARTLAELGVPPQPLP